MATQNEPIEPEIASQPAGEVISMIVSEGDAANTRGFSDLVHRVVVKPISAAVVHAGVQAACDGLAKAFSGLKEVGGFKLSEITFAISIDAKGGVQVVGTAGVGASGTITLKFVGA